MSEPMTMMAMAGFGLAALGIMLFAALKGWQGWLDLKRLELESVPPRAAASQGGMAERIELADLKERIRKLESIAACIDL
ncbi:MAG TPA: hypothetical protein VK403_00685 [Allosphingosinicella sp.]|nr:hypothetical protein [Allosphingosinicella sp.]